MTKKIVECTIIILGATGDLTKRKLIPALYRLILDKKIERYAVIGASFSQTTPEAILQASRPFVGPVNEEIWNKFANSFYYHEMDFHNAAHFKTLKAYIESIEQKHDLCGNRLFYLATLPEHFAIITRHLAKQKIVLPSSQDAAHPWSRVVYEKPFGHDAKSAKAINKEISKVFSEQQVFRIDHYLGKELVGNIALLRFTNIILEPLWNKKYIDSVQIMVTENIGIEGRGHFYERYGLVRDVVQNHLLQLVSLIAMEKPEHLSDEFIRNAKVKVLKKIAIKDVLLGQYKGYKEENGVQPNSKTETFAALKLEIKNQRWQGVPFFLKAGKALDAAAASIHIKFKKAACLLMDHCPLDSNYLTIQIQPKEGFFLEINAKIPGFSYAVTPAKMDFCHKSLFGPNTPQAYEVLLADVIKGDQSVFVRFDEIDASWKIVDSTNAAEHPVFTYEEGSKGPEELRIWSTEHGVQWRD